MLSNEALWFLFLILDLGVLLVLFRFFGRTGLYIAIAYSILLCNIQVLKTVELFGMTATLGNILYGSLFLATDILGEVYGKSAARKGVIIGFVVLLIMTVYMQLALQFQPDSSDFVDPHLQAIFGFLPRVAAASFIAYMVSQFHDVWAFHYWKARFKGRHLWLRNNLSTIVSQAIDSVVFCSIAFIGVFETSVVVSIFVTTYVLKLVVAILDTPFIYLACRMAGHSRGTGSGAGASSAG
ncbi:queuosine precursor transporter [bacterium]|nr:queuosine precursor transporter [bacterium]